MMSWLKRKNSTPAVSSWTEHLRYRLSNSSRRWGGQLSAWLSKHERRMRPTQRKRWAAALCLGLGLMCMTELYQGLFVYDSRPPTFLSSPDISVPILPRLPDSIVHRREAGKFYRDTVSPFFHP